MLCYFELQELMGNDSSSASGSGSGFCLGTGSQTERLLSDPKEGDFWQADHWLPVAEGGGRFVLMALLFFEALLFGLFTLAMLTEQLSSIITDRSHVAGSNHAVLPRRHRCAVAAAEYRLWLACAVDQKRASSASSTTTVRSSSARRCTS